MSSGAGIQSLGTGHFYVVSASQVAPIQSSGVLNYQWLPLVQPMASTMALLKVLAAMQHIGGEHRGEVENAFDAVSTDTMPATAQTETCWSTIGRSRRKGHPLMDQPLLFY